MNSNDDILEKIERFTKGQMSPEEADLFEKEISQDKELQKQVELSEIAENLVVFHETAKLKSLMQKDFAKQKLRKQIIWGSSILALIVASFFLWNTKKETISEKKELSSKQLEKTVKSNEEKNEVAKIADDVEEKQVENSVIEKLPSAYNESKSQKEKVVEKKDVALRSENLELDKLSGKREEKVVDAPKAIEKQVVVDIPIKTMESETLAEVKLCDYKLEGLKYSVSPSCKGESSGRILILKDGIKGGKAPYQFQIGTTQTKNNFENLPAKEYTLYVKDANGCTKEFSEKIRVKEVSCEIEQYVFNPEYDKVWQFPFDENKTPRSVVIKDDAGHTFYSSEISGLEPSEWNGESNKGMISKAGVYFYSILYSDNSIDDGTITVSK